MATTLTAPRTNRKPRKPAKETHGTCYLKATGTLTLTQALESGDALLTLHTDSGVTNYTVMRLSDPDGETIGYRLMKLTQFIVDRKVYDIDITPGYCWQCDCPDALYQNRECKHVRALRAALTQNGITVSTPKPAAKPEAKTCSFCLRTKCEC
jgi:hypothetical protein